MNLPAGMRARHRGDTTYYFLDSGAKPRKEIALGKDYVVAVQKWAELTIAKPVTELITFRYAAERYMRDVLPGKSRTTQIDNLRELKQLYKFFDDPPAPLEKIDPVHVRQYLDFRVEAKVRANREKALFSAIWNYARERGLTARENPCRGVKGFKESGRSVYVHDTLYQLVWDVAEPPLQDAMDLAYATSLRPADTLKQRKSFIIDGALCTDTNKTGVKVRYEISGSLEALIKRISSRQVSSIYLISNADGQPLTKSMLRGAFDRARAAAIAKHPEMANDIRNFQFRDLRAKAATDTEETKGMQAAQDQLAHTTSTMTARYVRPRRGKLVKPTK